MASKSDWFPSRMADQLVMFQNIANKIGAYSGGLYSGKEQGFRSAFCPG